MAIFSDTSERDASRSLPKNLVTTPSSPLRSCSVILPRLELSPSQLRDLSTAPRDTEDGSPDRDGSLPKCTFVENVEILVYEGGEAEEEGPHRTRRVRKKNTRYLDDFVGEDGDISTKRLQTPNFARQKGSAVSADSDEVWSCDGCERSYDSRVKLKRHIRTVHGGGDGSGANKMAPIDRDPDHDQCEEESHHRIDDVHEVSSMDGADLLPNADEYLGATDLPSTIMEASWQHVIKEEVIIREDDVGEDIDPSADLNDDPVHGVHATTTKDHPDPRWRPRIRRRVGGGVVTRCRECGKTFNGSGPLKRHAQRCHDRPRVNHTYRCHVCINDVIASPGDALENEVATFATKQLLARHIKNAHPELGDDPEFPENSEVPEAPSTQKSAVVCPFEGCTVPCKLTNRNDWIRHVKMYHPLSSPPLNEEAVEAAILDDGGQASIHRNVGEEEEEMVNAEAVSFKTEPTEMRVAQYICGSCDRRFATKSSLVHHVTNVHEDKNGGGGNGGGHSSSNGSRVCLLCDRTFRKSFHLNRHMASDIHADLLRYQCSHCGARFFDQTGLNQHLADFFYHADPALIRAPKYICYLCTYPNLPKMASDLTGGVFGSGSGDKNMDMLAATSASLLVDQSGRDIERSVVESYGTSVGSVETEADILSLIDPGTDGTRKAIAAVQRILHPNNMVPSTAIPTNTTTADEYLRVIATSSDNNHQATVPYPKTGGLIFKIVKFNKREEYIRHLKKQHPDHYFATFGQPLNTNVAAAPLNVPLVNPYWYGYDTANQPGSSDNSNLTFGQDVERQLSMIPENPEDYKMATAAASYTVDNNLVITIGNNVTSVFQVTALPQTGVKVKRRSRHDLGEDVGFSCRYCGKCLAYDRSLKQHIKTMHREEWNASASHRIQSRSNAPGIVVRRSRLDLAFDPGHLCEYCGKTLAYPRSLREHIKTVHRNLEEGGDISDNVKNEHNDSFYQHPNIMMMEEGNVGESCVVASAVDEQNIQNLQIVENISDIHGGDDRHHSLQRHYGTNDNNGDSIGQQMDLYGRVKRRSRFDLKCPGFLCNFCGKTLAYDRSLKYHIKSVHWKETAMLQEQHQQQQLQQQQELMMNLP